MLASFIGVGGHAAAAADALHQMCDFRSSLGKLKQSSFYRCAPLLCCCRRADGSRSHFDARGAYIARTCRARGRIIKTTRARTPLDWNCQMCVCGFSHCARAAAVLAQRHVAFLLIARRACIRACAISKASIVCYTYMYIYIHILYTHGAHRELYAVRSYVREQTHTHTRALITCICVR